MKKALVVLSPGFEEIEAVTVIDLLRRASVNVVTVGLEAHFVSGSHNIAVKCDAQPNEINTTEFDILVLPGGQPGTDNMKKNTHVNRWIHEFNKQNKLIAAICAAPAVLQQAGITDGLSLTSYPGEKNSFPNSKYREDKVVMDKNIITSRGVGTAIEFSLFIIEQLADKKTSEILAERIVYKN